MKIDRIVILPKDVQRMTGRSERYGRILLKRIKEHFKKEEHQFVTIQEFSIYTGINIELVTEYIS